MLYEVINGKQTSEPVYAPIASRRKTISNTAVFLSDNEDVVRHIYSFLDGSDILRHVAVCRKAAQLLPSCVLTLRMSVQTMAKAFKLQSEAFLVQLVNLETLDVHNPKKQCDDNEGDVALHAWGCSELDVSQDNVGEYVVARIASAISMGACKKLRRLRLVSAFTNTCRENAIEALSTALQLRTTPLLEDLLLGGNSFSDSGTVDIAALVRTGALPNLVRLDLRRNFIGESGLKRIMEALGAGTCPKLKFLCMGGNIITDNSVAPVIALLSSTLCPQLRFLGLEDNFISARGVQSIIQAAVSGGMMPKLHKVCFWYIFFFHTFFSSSLNSSCLLMIIQFAISEFISGHESNCCIAAMPSDISYFFGGPLAINTFILGAALDLYVFRAMRFPLDRVFGTKEDETPSVNGVGMFGAMLFVFLGGLYYVFRHNAILLFAKYHELILVFYCLVVLLLLFAPCNVLHLRFRKFLGKKLYQCLFPFQWNGTGSIGLPAVETPFVEVFLADGLTSMSKIFHDIAVASLMLMETINGQHSEHYMTKMKYHPLPYLCAAWPYLIRATQCLISYKRAPLANDKFLHILNTFKYGTGLCVIFVGAFPALFGSATTGTSLHVLDGQTMFLLCACCNSLYSLFWDVVMDWGLCQPQSRDIEAQGTKPHRFLRQTLLYKQEFVYYGAMGLDCFLRILWATSNWQWVDIVGAEFKIVMEVAEVLRRCMWNVFRVEWQCVKLGLEMKATSSTMSSLPRTAKSKNSNDRLDRLEKVSYPTSPTSIVVDNANDDEEPLLMHHQQLSPRRHAQKHNQNSDNQLIA
ncbi:hypothetical protein THRCLA_05784 [Thraustotheca clavata]|uniref:EXS domain-containing protein n=1 Tax=Thraustotheca clavata TaxID=74557 RepID=A0A1V9ZSR3_9STRA|nr:hypothetical protein THRCLA_05784 [Thraustotheca clavata]